MPKKRKTKQKKKGKQTGGGVVEAGRYLFQGGIPPIAYFALPIAAAAGVSYLNDNHGKFN